MTWNDAIKRGNCQDCRFTLMMKKATADILMGGLNFFHTPSRPNHHPCSTALTGFMHCVRVCERSAPDSLCALTQPGVHRTGVLSVLNNPTTPHRSEHTCTTKCVCGHRQLECPCVEALLFFFLRYNAPEGKRQKR